MAKSERIAWDREQSLLVMNLYCRLPFGKQHARNAQVVQLANALGRTAGSVAMKLNNFTSLDPAERSRGVSGLSGTSRLDKQVWDEFHADWNALSAESEALWEQRIEGRSLAPDSDPTQPADDTASIPAASEVLRLVRVRLTQRFFREAVLASFNDQCCITGNPIPALLEAAHIQPWATGVADRTNPRNGLCLSRVHHTAFDLGLITLDEAYRIVVSRELRDYLPNEALEAGFIIHEGKPIRMPEKFRPDQAFLAEHRQRVFKA